MTTHPLRQSLTYLLRTANVALRTVLDDALQPRGLSLPQLGVLTALYEAPGLSNAELARSSSMSPQAMNESIATLERMGLVTRGPDEANARILRASLTAAGRRKLQQAGAEITRVETAIRTVLTTDEQRVLRNLLERTTAALMELRA